MDLKYLIVGSGAVGGFSTAILTRIGKDVTMIARGVNYDVIKKEGLHVTTPSETYRIPVKVSTWADYDETPDVVILAMKSYSLDAVIPELDRICGPETVIYPVSNALDLGSAIAEKMTTQATVLGGVVYIVSERPQPGYIHQKSKFYELVAGMRDGAPLDPAVLQMQADFNAAGASFHIAANPVKAALRKFFRVSVVSAVTCYYDTTAGPIQEDPEKLDMLKGLIQELSDIAKAMGDPFGEADQPPFPGRSVEEDGLYSFMRSTYDYQPSMKFDWDKDVQTEIRTQILDVIDLGEKYGLPMTHYREAAKGMIAQKPDQVSEADRTKYGQ